MFELSRDYQKAFTLIKSGHQLACFLDYNEFRDVAKCLNESDGTINISARGISYIYLFTDQSQTSDFFEQECNRLNVEFYLPIIL